MRDKITTVGVVFGGISGEHNVSIKSAATVINALRDNSNKKKFEVVSIYIDAKGAWWSGDISEEVLKEGSSFLSNHIVTSSPSREFTRLPAGTEAVDVWFPLLHGPNGEDGTIQGLFKLTGKPFVGSGILGSALGMDKLAMKAAFAKENLPQVTYCKAYAKDLLDKERKSHLIQQIESELGFPCFVKPANLGSSVGITKAQTQKELIAGLTLAAQLDQRIIIEQSIKARELECAVLGKKYISASCVGEIDCNSDWYDYDSKYSENSAKIIIPAPIKEHIAKKVRDLSLLACKAIAAEGIARVDFFYEEDKDSILINEINTLPGFTSKSMYPLLWAASGINLSQLVARLVESAKE